jgi:hypothetical protein
VRARKFRPRVARCRKILQTTWHKAYSEHPPFTHKILTSYPQALTLQRRPDRIILYLEHGKPLHVGFQPKIANTIQCGNSSDFLTELGAISTAKPLQWQPEQQFLGSAQNL